MPLPSVSVITPSYNQAAFLRQTMNSVLSQGIPDLEYVVMDGGSDDGSLELIKSYAERLSAWVSEKDRGQADAVNKGVACTHGDIIGWLNSDDLYLPGTLKAVQQYFAGHPEVDLVYGDVISIDGNGSLINVMCFDDYSVDDLMTFRVISQPGVFFRRSLWQRSAGLDLSYHYLLDHHLWLRMTARGRMAYVREPWAAARFHAQAKNRAHTEDFGKEAYRLAEWMLQDELLAAKAAALRNQIFGGAAWLDAHYLSDGAMPAKSLRAYAKAFRLFPQRVLEDRRRVLLTLLMLISPVLSQKAYTSRLEKRLSGMADYNSLLQEALSACND